MSKVQAPLRFKKGDKVSVCLCGSIWYSGTITNAEIKRGLKPYTIEDEDGGVKYANEEFVFDLKTINVTMTLADFCNFKGDFKANGLKLATKGDPLMKELHNVNISKVEVKGKYPLDKMVQQIEFKVDVQYLDKIASMISKYTLDWSVF